ncbi:c-type cytochrome [Litorilituus lipolyticus]|uniref:C-type cytochrome n=1 Tax=Litorilituus lipolyticus TaxID=2491017 RepID=A0A502KQD6_9GAMM|nr:c-type cytochrome [Litorilituus lipolyticus]TPH13404.1 c-type cytochrome [Litorilituus lipolyticus]
MKKIIFSLILAFGLMNAAQAAQGDAAAGKTKAAACGACHGAAGISAMGIYPNIAGQKDAYIIKQLNDFKSGARTDMMMAPMAANLSEQDMADLAAYYASLPMTAEEAPAAAAASSDAPTATASTGTAEVVTSSPAAAIYNGDIKAGQSKSGMCVACHGVDGNSAVPMYPSIAGQSASYITKQLADFKSGLRVDPVMAGMVAALTEEDMRDLGAYFAVQAAKAGSGETNAEGHKLYFGGDSAKGITACIACHGVKGKGMQQAAFPAVAAQSKDYLKKQLTSFRDGSRANDNSKIMRNIAIKLSDAQIDALAQYMSGLK